MFDFVMEVCRKRYEFADFEECSAYFKTLINLFKQLNYTQWKSAEFDTYRAKIDEFVATK